MKNKTLTTIISFLFALCACLVRVIHPVTFALHYTMFEAIASLTILCGFVGCMVFCNIQPEKRFSWAEHVGFAIFAFFETLNYIYFKECTLHDWNDRMALYTVIAFIVNYVLATYGYTCIKYWTQRSVATETKAKPFWKYFALFGVPYLIVAIINYPGYLMYDSLMQILQAFNLPNLLADQADLLNAEVLMTTHHPFIHTMIIKFFLWIGECIGSLDVGIFLYTLTQCIAVAAMLAYIMCYVQKFLPARTVKFWSIIFAFNPIMWMYVILMTKDTVFACLFAIFAIKIYEWVKDNSVIRSKKWWLGFLGISLLTAAFRNNFVYAFFITMIVFLFKYSNKKRILALLATFICIFGTYSYVLIPALGVSGGSIREVISVPFQQTANYAQQYILTDEEYEIISKVIDVEKIREEYTPEVSNAVKNTYHKQATNQELMDYFVTWFKMFWKHPKAYFDAYFNQFYGYFSTRPAYTAAYDSIINTEMRTHLIDAGVNLSPSNRLASNIFGTILSLWQCCPLLYLITNGGLYIWILLASMLCLRKRGQKHMLWMYLPFLLYFATLLISPANATQEYRYMFPYLLAMPVFLIPIYTTNSDARPVEQALEEGE